MGMEGTLRRHGQSTRGEHPSRLLTSPTTISPICVLTVRGILREMATMVQRPGEMAEAQNHTTQASNKTHDTDGRRS